MSLIRHADQVKVLHEQYMEHVIELKNFALFEMKTTLSMDEAKYVVDVLTDIDREISTNEWNGERPLMYSASLMIDDDDLTENVQSVVKAYLESSKYFVRINKRGFVKPIVTFSISISPIQ